MMLALAAALLALQPAPAHRWTAVIAPADECAADRDFADFRARLLDVLARRDVAQLRELVAQDVFYSFGGSDGRDAFFAQWGLNDPAASALWTSLAEVLMLGCARRGAEMVAPYAFANWPEFDGVGMSFLARPGAGLYERPSAESDPVATLAWHVVEDLSQGEGVPESAWRRVRLADGRTGFVRDSELRSDIDFRAIFERRGGRWLLTTFVAGD